MCVLWIAIPRFAFSQVPDGNPSAENTAVEDISAPENTPLPEAAGTGRGTPASRAEEALFSFDDEAPANPAANPASAFSIFKMVLVLGLVALLIYLVVFFLRRLSRPQTGQNPHLRILASTHLGSGRYLHVVSVGTRAWLIGSGEGGISCISGIDEKEAIDAMLLDASQKSAEAGISLSGFQALLKRFSAPAGTPEDRLEKLRERRERFTRF